MKAEAVEIDQLGEEVLREITHRFAKPTLEWIGNETYVIKVPDWHQHVGGSEIPTPLASIGHGPRGAAEALMRSVRDRGAFPDPHESWMKCHSTHWSDRSS